jgi:pyruvate/2-oxoglutarate dehydrogenase complex dihydrolipoamide dehydrogenase (E3) component
MNRTKKLLIGLVTVVAMPSFADTKTTSSSSGENSLEELFKADLQYRSESESDHVIGERGQQPATKNEPSPGEKILIATGSRPVVPSIEGLRATCIT